MALLSGALTAFGSWIMLFTIFGPAEARGSFFHQLGAASFGIVTLVAAVAVVADKTAWAYRFLFGALTATVLLWNAATPSIGDGFSGVHWATTIGLALICLAVLNLVESVTTWFATGEPVTVKSAIDLVSARRRRFRYRRNRRRRV